MSNKRRLPDGRWISMDFIEGVVASDYDSVWVVFWYGSEEISVNSCDIITRGSSRGGFD